MYYLERNLWTGASQVLPFRKTDSAFAFKASRNISSRTARRKWKHTIRAVARRYWRQKCCYLVEIAIMIFAVSESPLKLKTFGGGLMMIERHRNQEAPNGLSTAHEIVNVRPHCAVLILVFQSLSQPVLLHGHTTVSAWNKLVSASATQRKDNATSHPKMAKLTKLNRE